MCVQVHEGRADSPGMDPSCQPVAAELWQLAMQPRVLSLARRLLGDDCVLHNQARHRRHRRRRGGGRWAAGQRAAGSGVVGWWGDETVGRWQQQQARATLPSPPPLPPPTPPRPPPPPPPPRPPRVAGRRLGHSRATPRGARACAAASGPADQHTHRVERPRPPSVAPALDAGSVASGRLRLLQRRDVRAAAHAAAA